MNDDRADSPPKGRLHALKHLSHRALIYGTGQAASRLIALLILPISTVYLSRSDFGLLAILMFAGHMYRTVLSLGMSQALGILYFDKADVQHKTNVVQSAFLAFCGFGILGLAALPFIWSTLPTLGITWEVSFTLIVLQAFTTVFHMAADPLMLKLQFDERPIVYVFVGIGSSILGACISVLLMVVAGMGLLGILIGSFIGSILMLAIALWATNPFYQFSYNKKHVQKLMRLGLPFVPGSLITLIMLNSAPALIARLATLEEAGIYALGAQFGNAMGMIVAAVTAAWYPFFMSYKTRQNEASNLFPSLSLAYIISLGFLTLLFFVLAWPAVTLFTAEPFWPSYEIVGIIAASQAVLGLWSFLLPALYYAEETRLILIPQFLAGLATLAVQFILIPPLGAMGAALGILTGITVLNLSQLILNYARRYELRMFMLRRGLAIMICIGSFAILQSVTDEISSGLTWTLLSALGVVICAALVTILVPREIRDNIAPFLQNKNETSQ